jgi:RimJ/RimL family protein N-acetyltransferase
MQSTYKTKRLLLNDLSETDAGFIFELVNSPGWIQFIGDRNVRSKAEAVPYIQKIRSNPATHYWVVKLNTELAPVGIVTLIKRDYLEHHDIGFAFLPGHTKQGYAFEAVSAVLQDLFNSKHHHTLLAVTISENLASVQLLKKLGFSFVKELSNENDILHLYALTKNNTTE